MVALAAQNFPVLILEEETGGRMLPITIGAAEASSIDAEIHNQRRARPSDAIVTAPRVGAPIRVREQVFEEAGESPAATGREQAVAWLLAAARTPATRVAEL